MLTKKEIDKIPKGHWSNAALRQAFGKKHGSKVKEYITDKDGNTKEITIIGNRFQRRYRAKHPLKPLPVKHVDNPYQDNRILAKEKISLIGKIMQFFAKLLNRKAA